MKQFSPQASTAYCPFPNDSVNILAHPIFIEKSDLNKSHRIDIIRLIKAEFRFVLFLSTLRSPKSQSAYLIIVFVK